MFSYDPIPAVNKPAREEASIVSTMQSRQKGASAIGNIIILALVGYGIYVGMQYLPIQIESSSVDAILESVKSANAIDPATSISAVRASVDKQLDINQLNKLRDNTRVREDGNSYVITIAYERDLDLLFNQKKIHYEKTLRLN